MKELRTTLRHPLATSLPTIGANAVGGRGFEHERPALPMLQRPGGISPYIIVALALIAAIAGCEPRRHPLPPTDTAITARVAQYGPSVRARLLPFFSAAGVPYPPRRFLLLALKRERQLQLFAAGHEQDLAFVRSYVIRGMSGELGPKLREGDRQVPEGIYRIVYLNPNSIAHLSLALSYPNDFDRVHGEEDGREAAALGGDIMIHGGSGSVGCIAIGDEAAEDLFVLAADAGWHDTVIVVSPIDFRNAALPVGYHPSPKWVNQLYAWLRTRLATLPPAP